MTCANCEKLQADLARKDEALQELARRLDRPMDADRIGELKSIVGDALSPQEDIIHQ